MQFEICNKKGKTNQRQNQMKDTTQCKMIGVIFYLVYLSACRCLIPASKQPIKMLSQEYDRLRLCDLVCTTLLTQTQ